MSTVETSVIGAGPWRDSTPQCRVYRDSPWFRQRLLDSLGDAISLATRPDAGPHEAILVDCIESSAQLGAARRIYPSHPVVGVLGREDAARVAEVLAGGADGVISFADPPETWRRCLQVVIGGGRWRGG